MNKNSYLIDLSESPRTQFGKLPFAEQSEKQKVFSAIWEIESEVNNGGFIQYFANSVADVISFSPEALRTIGAKNMAAITTKAIQIAFPQGIPDLDDECNRIAENLDANKQEILEELDGEFMEYPDNLTDLLYDFVLMHRKEFGN